jgi:hypothetical protein
LSIPAKARPRWEGAKIGEQAVTITAVEITVTIRKLTIRMKLTTEGITIERIAMGMTVIE